MTISRRTWLASVAAACGAVLCPAVAAAEQTDVTWTGLYDQNRLRSHAAKCQDMLGTINSRDILAMKAGYWFCTDISWERHVQKSEFVVVVTIRWIRAKHPNPYRRVDHNRFMSQCIEGKWC